MKKQELISLAGKGLVTVGPAQIEVTISNTTGSDFLNITQKAVNPYTTDHQYSGGWVEYITDESVEGLESAVEKVHAKMLQQAEVCKKTPLVLTSIDGSNNLRSEDGEYYIIERLKDHFEILKMYKDVPEYSINVPVLLDGKLYLPLWSWWLDKGCYIESREQCAKS